MAQETFNNGDPLLTARATINANAVDAEPRLTKADNALPKAGGAMNGNIDMGGNAVINQLGMVNDPANNEAQARAMVCGAASTGVLTGGAITPNIDPTLFDVEAGTGLIIDWLSPDAPKRKYIKWDEMIGESIPVMAAGFTSMYFEESDTMVKDPAGQPNGNDYRSRVYLQSVIHQNFSTINAISSGRNPAYEVSAALFDYIRFLGPLNKGNCFIPNGVGLTFTKEVGETALPFINFANDPQNPTIQTDPEIIGVSNFSYTHRDSGSGFINIFPVNAANGDLRDDGSGTLVSVTNNRFTVQRMFWFPQSGSVTLSVGQEEYQNIQDAKDAFLTDVPSIDPLITNNGSLTAFLIIQQGATDLSDPAQTEFVCRDQKQ